MAWSTLPGYRTYLGSYFSEFLLGAGIDHPCLASSETELRAVALSLLSYLRGRRGRRGGRSLSRTSVGLAQSAVQGFYLFIADHRYEAANALGEPRWSELTDAHARLWRAGEFVRRDRGTGPADYIDPEALGRIVSHLDILALPRDQTKTVIVDGERREVAGRGDPQAMRAFLLEVLTGRRINEILVIDPEPLIPLPGIDADAEHDPEAFVARLRYRQTKIGGAPDTILVEREVVNIVTEQQRWLQEHLAAMNPASPPEPRYLFVAWQSNRKGTQPYSAHTLRDRLHGLATELQIRDQHGRLVDFQRTHRMRHTRATELLNGGVPIHVVQRYLGHLSPEMTMRYADTLVAVGTALRSGRDLRPHRPRAAPRADPSVRDYRTGLLPWVVAAKRCSGQGCRIWGRGSHRSARRLIRSQVSRSCWLRRRSVNSQFRVIWSRKAESALLLSGSGGRGHRSPRLPQIPA